MCSIASGQKPRGFGWRRQWVLFEFFENLLDEYSCIFEPDAYLSISNSLLFLNIWKKKKLNIFLELGDPFYAPFPFIIVMINSLFFFLLLHVLFEILVLWVLDFFHLHSFSLTFPHFYLCPIFMNFGNISELHSIFHANYFTSLQQSIVMTFDVLGYVTGDSAYWLEITLKT